MLRLPGFTCPKDWDGAHDHAIKMGVEPALAFFRRHLGEGWRGWTEGYPLAGAFFTQIQGVAIGPQAYEVLQALSAESSDKAVHQMGVRLGSPDWAHYEGTELEIAVAGACVGAGVRTVLRESNQPGADLVVAIGDAPILVECKALQRRDLDRELNDHMDRLMQAAWAVRNQPVRVVLEGSPEDFLSEAPKAVDYLESVGQGTAAGQRTFGPIRILPGEQSSNGSCPVEGPGIAAFSRSSRGDLLDLMKVRQTVRAKSRQLNGGKGVFVVGVSNTFLGRVSPEEIADHLLETVTALPNVSALMIVQRNFTAGNEPRLLNAPGVWIFAGASTRGLQTVAMMVENPAARHPLARPEVEKLVRLVPAF